MACLEMYNPDHKGAPPPPPPPPMSPRISFSNDFAESSSYHHHHHHQYHHQAPPSSTDFEFSVTSNNSLQLSPADELFFKGRILPSFQRPPPTPTTTTTTTLRDELLAGDDDEDDDGVFSIKPPQSHKGRWKGFLGLRKSHIGSKKPDPSPLRSLHEPSNFFSFPLQDHPRSPPQGVLREDEEETVGGADMEMKL